MQNELTDSATPGKMLRKDAITWMEKELVDAVKWMTNDDGSLPNGAVRDDGRSNIDAEQTDRCSMTGAQRDDGRDRIEVDHDVGSGEASRETRTSRRTWKHDAERAEESVKI